MSVSLIEMYKNGVSVRKIASRCGVSVSTVFYRLRKSGVKRDRRDRRSGKHVGEKFGHLVIKDIVYCRGIDGKNYRKAICICENCGSEFFEVILSSVLRGSTTSCGCRRDQYKKTTGKNSVQFTGFEGISGTIWSRIKHRSERRNVSFSVGIEEMWKLFLEQERKCALTGVDICFGNNSTETTASLDRIDSSNGYVADNVQWVHKDVNIMKNVFPMEYFVKVCNLVSNREI